MFIHCSARKVSTGTSVRIWLLVFRFFRIISKLSSQLAGEQWKGKNLNLSLENPDIAKNPCTDLGCQLAWDVILGDLKGLGNGKVLSNMYWRLSGNMRIWIPVKRQLSLARILLDIPRDECKIAVTSSQIKIVYSRSHSPMTAVFHQFSTQCPISISYSARTGFKPQQHKEHLLSFLFTIKEKLEICMYCHICRSVVWKVICLRSN